MKNNIDIKNIAKKMKLKEYVGVKVIARKNYLYRPNEIAEITGWSYDIFGLEPDTEYEKYFHLCARYDDGEIAQIPVNFQEMGFEILTN